MTLRQRSPTRRASPTFDSTREPETASTPLHPGRRPPRQRRTGRPKKMSEGEPGGWFTGVVHRRSLEGGAVVNSERTEAMDGRGERPVEQPPGSPERPTPTRTQKNGPPMSNTGGPRMMCHQRFSGTRKSTPARCVLLHLIGDRDVTGIRGRLEVRIGLRLLRPGAADRENHREQPGTDNGTHRQKSPRSQESTKLSSEGPGTSRSLRIHEHAPCPRQGIQ